MTSISTTNELSTNQQQDLDNSNITINSDSEIIIENNSTDDVVTTSCSEQQITTTTTTNTTTAANSTVKMKTQVLPLVYIQAPTSTKVPYTPINKPNTNNVVVNNVPQFQFASLDTTNNTKPTNCSLATNPGVIFTPVNNFTKSQHVVIQKSGGNVLPIVPVPVTSGAKIGAYLTMIKPVVKASEQIANKLQLSAKPQQDTLLITTNSILQNTNTPQKYVIAPMPKVTTNRLPATVTTNSVQSKIAFMPLSLPKTDVTATTTKKFFNFKITDGQIEPQNTEINMENNKKITGDNVVELECAEKKENGNKSYELSIAEEATSNNDVNVGISSTDGTMKLKLLKEPPKFTKHGVSILKKNFIERKQFDKIIVTSSLPVNNVQTSVSDVVSNADVTVVPKTEEEPIAVPPEPKITKPERRRKSHFSYRKDYDDVEIISDNKKPDEINNVAIKTEEEVDLEQKDLIEMKEKSINNNHLQTDIDLRKILKWDEDIGTLPGSKLKFIINEFNMVEYVTQDEYNKIVENKMTKAKEKAAKQEQFQQEMRCLECGCYGLPSEFINPKYCSYDCQDAGNKRPREMEINKYKKKRKRPLPKPKNDAHSTDPVMPPIKSEKEQLSGSEEDNNTSNENSQDRFSYPWSCKKKGFSWAKYLDHIKAKSAPVKLFKDPFPYTRNGFRPGMKLEGVDPQHPSYFCVLTVAEVLGYRIRLHFDGYPENYDFWVNADSMDIFPMGWCEKYGHVLHPPPGFTVDNFNWLQYLRQTKSTAAPKHLFVNRSGNSICPNGFRVGMKLEAVDRKNTSLVCVASVRDMMDNRILVHFDSWDDIYDYWADPTSPYIHPIGWCDQYGHNLTPPNDYPNPENFTWETYLKETKSVAAPVRAFKQRPVCGFKRGMRLECVDKRVPQLIRVATVDDVKDHQIRIHFDGWPDRYSYWVDDDSSDIHPVGWCQKTNHPIEPPLTPDDVYDFLECPTIGCRGQGHIRGPKYPTHSNPKHCPYAEDNIDAEKILPDRLLSPDRQLNEVVPVSREPKDKLFCRPKSKVTRPSKYQMKIDQLKLETNEEAADDALLIEKKPKENFGKRIKLEHNSSCEEKAIAFIELAKVTPAERESWDKHSKFLRDYVNVNSDPRIWSGGQVSDFVSSLPTCNKYKDVFRYEDIDGEAFLSLTQHDIVSILNVKVGPAVKLYNSILLLRQHVNNNFFT